MLALDPGAPERLAPQIAAKRDELDRRAEQARAEAFAATPQGREQAAERMVAERAERARKAELARVLLEEEGAPTSHLSDDEALWAAHLERKPAALMSHGERDAAIADVLGRWPYLSEDERRSEARAVGEDYTRLSAYHERFVQVRPVDFKQRDGEGQ